MSKKNVVIYIAAFLISILLIGLYFINTSNPWCQVCVSVGGSLIGAVVLGYLLEQSNLKQRKKEKETTFRLTCSNIYSEINTLFLILNIAITEIKKIGERSPAKFTNQTLKGLLVIFTKEIDEIKELIAPTITSGEPTEKANQNARIESAMLKEVRKFDESLHDLRKDFSSMRKQLEQNKTLLLSGNICSDRDFFALQTALSILSEPAIKRKDREEELIEMGESLKQIIDCGLDNVLEKTGFNKIVFDNKSKILNLELKSSKTKKKYNGKQVE